MQHTTPSKNQDRAQILDILRGIAILGILLNNIYGFSGYGFLLKPDKELFNTYDIDKVLNFLQITFVEGKFYSIFSLLFGVGFSIILTRNQQKEISPLKIFYRRLFVLLLLGSAHIYFLWEGDILLLYALVGMLLPLFKNCSNKALLLWAVIFILSPIAIDAIKYWLQATPGDFILPFAEAIDKKNGLVGEDWRRYIYIDGSGWNEWRNYQDTAFMYRYSSLLNNNRMPKVLGMFLIGFFAGRKMIYANLQQYKLLFKKIMFWGFIIGIPSSFAMAWFEADGRTIYKSAWGLADTVAYAFGVVPLSLAYISCICLCLIKRKGVSNLNVFAPVGRMALTNYLMQTIIASLLFYGAGLGWGQEFGLIYLFPIAIGMYSLQVFYSNIWFRHFQYGPMEWIWRQLTYGKRLPIKKKILKGIT